MHDRYAIERELGAGGMATVYLAQDWKHDRRVAIKVLRPELAAVIGAERFLSEIKTTANLQHAHILPLFDSGAAEGLLFYVMPYVEGETVRDRITREKQLPIDDAVRIAREVASALDYAHRRGVIHRDIKPENILLHDGQALVADFGIALAASKAGETRMTETGMSLGTPHYMSPEQAMGEREITPRSDVYALGCVLYEMLTGDPPFTGSTAQAIMARVLTETPRPMVLQRHTIPGPIEAAVFQALEKLPADRFATAAEFSEALGNPRFTARATAAALPTGALAGSRRSRALVGGGAILLLAVAAWGWLRPQPLRPVTRVGLAFPKGQEPSGDIVLSPDASHLVYVGTGDSGTQVWVKERDRYEATPLPGTRNSMFLGLSISPDGQWLAFTQGGHLQKVQLAGGAVITLVDSVRVSGSAWLDDGTIIYPYYNGTFALRRVAETGGASTELWHPEDTQAAVVFPSPLPGGRGVLFTVCGDFCRSQEDLWVLDLRSGKAHRLMGDALRGWYLPTGDLVYVQRGGGTFAVPFDLKSLEIRGTPVPVLSGTALFGGIYPIMTISSTGTLVMGTGGATGNQLGSYHLVWVDRAGKVTPVDTSWTFQSVVAAGNQGWSLSPDGRRLAIGLNSPSGDDIWIKELPAGPLSRLTFDSGSEERPRWRPDGKAVTYIEYGTPFLLQRSADGTGRVDTIVRAQALLSEGFWSRDGKWLIGRVGGLGGDATNRRTIIGLRPGVDSAPAALVVNDGFDKSAPALSPDGRWLAYVSEETGRSEVYVRPFPNTESGKWQVSTNGGQAPLWAHSGKELFYVDAAKRMMVVAVAPGISPGLGPRRVLFQLGDDIFLSTPEHYTPWDISPDDKRFIMIRYAKLGVSAAPSYIMVENWFRELKSRTAVK